MSPWRREGWWLVVCVVADRVCGKVEAEFGEKCGMLSSWAVEECW